MRIISALFIYLFMQGEILSLQTFLKEKTQEEGLKKTQHNTPPYSSKINIFTYLNIFTTFSFLPSKTLKWQKH